MWHFGPKDTTSFSNKKNNWNFNFNLFMLYVHVVETYIYIYWGSIYKRFARPVIVLRYFCFGPVKMLKLFAMFAYTYKHVKYMFEILKDTQIMVKEKWNHELRFGSYCDLHRHYEFITWWVWMSLQLWYHFQDNEGVSGVLAIVTVTISYCLYVHQFLCPLEKQNLSGSLWG